VAKSKHGVSCLSKEEHATQVVRAPNQPLADHTVEAQVMLSSDEHA
jgi:hypothetical protein